MGMKNVLDIGIDFDGTCVTHEYPRIGQDIGAAKVLKALVANGHNLILTTMRDNTLTGGKLDEALQWFQKNEIPLYGVQSNPGQGRWTSSPKAQCDLLIDDVSLGIPLIKNDRHRPYVDWGKVSDMLVEMELIGQDVNSYNLFLDDERVPNDVFNFLLEDSKTCLMSMKEISDYQVNEDWVIVRSFDEFVETINTRGIPDLISFDHDLADFGGENGEERTGMTCILWLGEKYMVNRNRKMFDWRTHTKNIVGEKNMRGYLENLEKFLFGNIR